MYTEKEKIALSQFTEQCFNRKAMPYQKSIIKLIQSGKKYSLKIMPRREPSSIKHRDFLKKLLEEHAQLNIDKLIIEGLSMHVVSVSHKPTLLIIDDIEAPFRNKLGMQHIPPIQNTQLFKNSMLSSIVLNNQVKKDVTKVRQSDIKASSEIHKIAKEARFGKSPDTVIVNANGNYSVEELNSMSLEQLEKLMREEQKKAMITAELVE